MFKLSRYFFILFASVGLLAAAPLAHAAPNQPMSHQVSVAQPVSASLLSEQTSIAPGEPFWVGVQLKMEQGWDTYWMNPGDAGFPTQIEWQLPKGFTASQIYWPAPQKFTSDQMVGFGYADSVMLLTKITPPKNISDQNIDIKAHVSWLACKESCEPGEADLALALPIRAQAEINASTEAQFAQAKAALPREATVQVQAKGDNLILNFQHEGPIGSAQFFPEQGSMIDYLAPQTMDLSKGGLSLSVKRSALNEVLPDQVKGVLLFLEEGTGIQHVIQVDSQLGQQMAAELSGFWVALALALAGGVILNFMPCVMPVIALKIFSFVKMAHEKRGLIFKHGLVFTLGVLVSFWLLSGALLLLRAYGQSVGWGFQLQEPVFVVILASILFLLGLSLFGLFEFGTSLMAVGQNSSRGKSPLVSSFMSGVLATLVATPCTGPLLGPALGFAMTLAPFKALMIFTAMGLGMASPYLLFAAFPRLVKFLPKPGNWMIVFKQIMGFIMMATVAWLVWVFGAQTSNLATFVLLLALLVMAIGGWIFGQWGAPTRKKRTRYIAKAIAALLIVFAGVQAMKVAKTSSSTEIVQQIKEGWERYSPEKVAAFQAEGKTVFVDFTAKWCLICQANKVVLHSSEVEKLFKAHGVIVMEADWTKKDPVITKQLERLGRTGVPVYALYPPEEGAEPYILPQTLSGNILSEYMVKVDAR
ncbi:MAG: thioredoxin family protein [Verrucomicrobia bacterium]|nr:thioredoxin family protein [Verrucomicrobiota bacterium]MBS0645399.1 thioredoxin family protein [Verrucomicrobiota bacterium]